MPLSLPILSGGLLWAARGLLSLFVLGWVVALVKVLIARFRPRWVLMPEDPPADPAVSVSIVIPARNEAGNLGPCLDAALAQDHPALQVVVLDDGSTDGTGEVLKRYAADPRVVALTGDGSPLPEGWFGKPWALMRAQEAASGRWLLFMDADVRLAPQAVSRAVGYAERESVDLLTGFGAGVMETFWEKVLQPAVAGLILAGNDLDAVNDPERVDRVIANGQFLMFRREAYDAIGGHRAVQADILDDVGLAQGIVGAGYRLRCLFMRRIFSCRMYTGFASIWEGWSKNLFAGMNYSWVNVILAVVWTFAVSQLGPLLALLGIFGVIGREWMWWGLALTALMQLVRGVMDWIWELPLRYGLTHAPSNLVLIALILHSAIRTTWGGVTWKGRRYELKPRRSGSSPRAAPPHNPPPPPRAG